MSVLPVIMLTVEWCDDPVDSWVMWPSCWQLSDVTILLTVEWCDDPVDSWVMWRSCWQLSDVTILLTVEWCDDPVDGWVMWRSCWQLSDVTILLTVEWCDDPVLCAGTLGGPSQHDERHTSLRHLARRQATTEESRDHVHWRHLDVFLLRSSVSDRVVDILVYWGFYCILVAAVDDVHTLCSGRSTYQNLFFICWLNQQFSSPSIVTCTWSIRELIVNFPSNSTKLLFFVGQFFQVHIDVSNWICLDLGNMLACTDTTRHSDHLFITNGG